MSIRFGVCTTFDKIPALIDAGYDYVEFGFGNLVKMTDEEFAEAKAAVEKYNFKAEAYNGFFPGEIRITGPDVDYDRITAHTEKGMARAAQLGGKVVTISGPDGYIYDPDGISTPEKVDYLLEMRASCRNRVQDYADKFGVEFFPGQKPWGTKADIIMPCATQNEVDVKEAEQIVANGVKYYVEVSNMPTTNEAVAYLKENAGFTEVALDLVETYTLVNMFYIVMAGMTIDVFEQAIYLNQYDGLNADVIMADGQITYDEYDFLYKSICTDFGALDVIGDYWQYGMTITSPCYYVSYSVSAISVLQLYEVAQTDGFDVAKEQYLKLFTYVDEDPGMGMEEIMAYAGMLSFKDEQLYIDLSNYFAM